MRKLNRNNPQCKKYGPAVLWADDLRDMIDALKGCENILFVADEVQYDSVDEFVSESRGRTARNVSISTEKPNINLDLDGMRTSLSVLSVSISKDELVSLGLFKKLDDLLSRCERRPRWLYKFYTGPLIVFGGIGASRIPGIPEWLSLTIYFATLPVVVWVVFVTEIALRRHSFVRPFFRGDAPGFFRRNKDSIIVAVISALIGSIFGAVATKAVDKVWPTPATPMSKSSSEHP